MSLKKTHKEFAQLITNANPYAGRVGLVYARVSSKRQELEGSGLESQQKRCVNDLTSIGVPHGKTFPDTFTGHGDFMQRPAMRALITYIDANPHKKFLVIFDDLSRFARDVEFHIKLRATFRSRDVILRCLNYNFDDTPEGKYAELIMAGGAELFRMQNQRQVIQKMKSCLERGYLPFARKRGYDRVKDPVMGKTHVPNKDGKLMKFALEGFATGRFRRKVDVARYLHEHGFWNPSKRPADKFVDDVTEMLSDVFHAGYIEYPEWGVTRRKGIHKGIITLDTFELNQKRLLKEETKARIRIDISPDFPLRGLVNCPECGQKLTGAPSLGARCV
jgi:DNA invertase Pin-like site-specific DNA recombinase